MNQAEQFHPGDWAAIELPGDPIVTLPPVKILEIKSMPEFPSGEGAVLDALCPCCDTPGLTVDVSLLLPRPDSVLLTLTTASV